MSAPVLIATDFSEYSAQATRMGMRLALATGAPLLLIHVVEPIGNPAEADQETAEFHTRLIQEGRNRLNAEVQSWTGDQPAVTLIELGHRVPTLLRLIEEHRPALVVMGSRLRDLRRVGISLEVLLQCSYPVLLVPHHVEEPG